MSEQVYSPKHYTAHPSGVECITITEHFSFNIGNAIKYLWRCGLKGDEIEDLKKARWYIDREIDRRQRADAAALEAAGRAGLEMRKRVLEREAAEGPERTAERHAREQRETREWFQAQDTAYLARFAAEKNDALRNTLLPGDAR